MFYFTGSVPRLNSKGIYKCRVNYTLHDPTLQAAENIIQDLKKKMLPTEKITVIGAATIVNNLNNIYGIQNYPQEYNYLKNIVRIRTIELENRIKNSIIKIINDLQKKINLVKTASIAKKPSAEEKVRKLIRGKNFTPRVFEHEFTPVIDTMSKKIPPIPTESFVAQQGLGHVIPASKLKEYNANLGALLIADTLQKEFIITTYDKIAAFRRTRDKSAFFVEDNLTKGACADVKSESLKSLNKQILINTYEGDSIAAAPAIQYLKAYNITNFDGVKSASSQTWELISDSVLDAIRPDELLLAKYVNAEQYYDNFFFIGQG
jgi:hypothetical protein